MSKPFSSFPQPTIHKQRDTLSQSERVAISFISEEHMEAFRDHLREEGYKKGKEEGLVDLQREARTLFKNVFGKDL